MIMDVGFTRNPNKEVPYNERGLNWFKEYVSNES